MSAIQRDCPNCPDPCNERHRRIWDLLFRDRDGGGGLKGLVHRYAEQIADGAKGPGTDVWINHERTYYGQRRSLNGELKAYKNSYNDNGKGGKDPCPNTPLIQEAEKWVKQDAPTAAEWEANQSPSTLARIGWGTLGTVAAVGAVAAFFVPFDGPAGETVLGLAAGAAWRRALAGAAQRVAPAF